jgi:hypothetical protein
LQHMEKPFLINLWFLSSSFFPFLSMWFSLVCLPSQKLLVDFWEGCTLSIILWIRKSVTMMLCNDTFGHRKMHWGSWVSGGITRVVA